MCIFHDPAGFRPTIFDTFLGGLSKVTILYLGWPALAD
jgi:hypothetical protein